MNKTDRIGIARLMPAPQCIAEAADMHTMTQRDHDLIRDLRYVMHENQTQFWRRFGVTQTQGSRFERGKSIPLPVLLLIRLYLLQLVDDNNLQHVRSPEFGHGCANDGAIPASRSGQAVLP